jgi:hypothetical protein
VEDESRYSLEAKHGLLAKDWWPAGHLLSPFFLSLPLSTSLAQPPHLWDKVEGPRPQGLAARPPFLESFSMFTSNLKFLESFSKFLACLS